MDFKGMAYKFGDDINTDYIISSRRKRDTLDLDILKQYIMEDIDESFAKRVKENDIIVAGENFGCGSAMEVASLVIKAAGINVILAKSFSRTFYRNGINGGILLVECDTDMFSTSDILKVEADKDKIKIENCSKNTSVEAQPLDEITMGLIEIGGLVNFIKEKGDFQI
ncbi:MAG TPA: 3-isopropylmalate dehydratase [Patescibacteria group bacterium]|nr:3-isopropylmalate dehydratase [Patescibacteria group bacterium]